MAVSSQYLTLYKMIVLYMLWRCDMPLSKSQIYDFILEKEYTTFLTLQEVFRILMPVSIGIGVGMGLLGSYITVRRYLKV